MNTSALARCIVFSVVVVILIASALEAQVRSFERVEAPPTVMEERARALEANPRLNLNNVTVERAVRRAVPSNPSTLGIDPARLGLREGPGTELLRLDERYLVQTTPGRPPVEIQPTIINHAMLWDPVGQVFRGSIGILLLQENIGTAAPLPESFNFYIDADLAEVEPRFISLNTANAMPVEVRLADGEPMRPVVVSVRTPAQPEGIPIEVKVRPRVVIEAPPPGYRMQGFGIERIPVTMVLRGAMPADCVRVAVTAMPGSVEPKTVMVKADGPAHVSLRSGNIGDARIRVTAPGYANEDLNVRYTLPVRFLLFALIGGLLGSVVALFLGKKENRPAAGKFIAGWTLFGLIAAAAYVGLGLNLVGIDVPIIDYFSEIVVFVIGALAPIGRRLLA